MSRRVLILVQHDPGKSAKAEEGLRCAYGLAALGASDIRLALCDEALDLLSHSSRRSTYPPRLQDLWDKLHQGLVPIYALHQQASENPLPPKAPIQLLSPSAWLDLALEHEVILLF